ncbi:hypothetical protein [Luteolibacter flavescens]|uniref:hypothetical protein n=1 Tax=Luteolibacter flavescens TaxID=1859460 RepID=UPI00222235F0|nr:hypothetical protein [Luteolibacter flavescens]
MAQKLIKAWRPIGTALENALSTLSRYALRVIDRQTGEAYSADELQRRTVSIRTTPLTGFTILAAAFVDQVHYLTPAGTLATGTFRLPAAAFAKEGQIVRLLSTATQTALTVNVLGGGTISGAAVTSLVANTSYAWQCVNTNGAGAWIRI